MGTDLFTDEERRFGEDVVCLTYCNPFSPERVEIERAILGSAFRNRGRFWSRREDVLDNHPNIERIMDRVARLLGRITAAAPSSSAASLSWPERDAALYRDLATFHLYHRFHEHFDRFIRRPPSSDGERRAPFWPEFETEIQRLAAPAPRDLFPAGEGAHLFALCFQVRRAFNSIYDHIIGESEPAARLRASIWESIFTHDMARYRRSLYNRMGEFTCLITGPSGTGKELVARAIGLSRYIPFDRARQLFRDSYTDSFYALNLSALSPTLIESELFGHRKGAFTGAVMDRAGYLEVCPALGSVFLDEIGEIDGSIQVKLLRLLQSRTFQRIGDTKPLPFQGKFMAATNRDLFREMQEGRFREDLYYRLCGDVITTPSLREQLSDSPEALRTLVGHIAARLVGEEEAASVTEEVTAWISVSLPPGYSWPGNVRELEQCVRNIVVRKSYRPSAGGTGKAPAAEKSAAQPPALPPDDPRTLLLGNIARAAVTLDDLLAHYCSMVYAMTDSYQETGRVLGADHRTVKARLVPELVQQYREACRENAQKAQKG